MSDHMTRRAVLKGVAITSAALAVPLAVAQATTTDTQAVEKQLTAKISDEARKLLKSTLEQNAQSTKSRIAFKLTENSEPCFVFPATPAKARKAKS